MACLCVAANVCVCVCVCARVRARVCVCVCVYIFCNFYLYMVAVDAFASSIRFNPVYKQVQRFLPSLPLQSVDLYVLATWETVVLL